jgi:hydrophobe/amphiphile efflux-1 (HAE1) family protein
MNLSSLSINRPVTATVFSLVILLFGIIGYTYLPVREFPSIDPPVVTVTTNYPGANADIIESQITESLEESVNGIDGIKTLTSISSDGRSTITVEFELSVDMEAAANDVRDKVSRAVRNLPPDADPPIVQKSDADAETILSISVQSDKRTLLELSEIGNNMFKERLQTVPGVSEIRIWGEKKYAMKIALDPELMSAKMITPLDVREALNKENIELPSGRIEGYFTELTVRTNSRLSTEEEFNNLIVSERDGNIIRLNEVGNASLRPENERTILRGNGGIPMIGIAITPQPGTNYIQIADEVYKRVEQIKKEIPDDLVLGVALDTTVGIRKAIKEVNSTILIAFSLVVIVVFLFLKSWRSTLIPVIAIPVSLIGAFFIMYASGFSINVLTLLGIVLATGLVVDDAIVVMENIYTKIEHGMSPEEASHKGSKEVYFAVISTTITLVAVFLPIVFLDGLTGRLFREFGIVVAGSVIISSFVSLSLTPMMSSKILKKEPKKVNGWFNSLFEKFSVRYKNSLETFIENRWLAFAIMFVSVAITFVLGAELPSELAPMEDKSRLRIMSTAPEGTSYELMESYIGELIALTDSLPEKESLLSVTAPGFGASIAVNSGFVRLMLVPPDKRTRTQQEIADYLNSVLRKHNFARSFVIQEQTIGGGRMSGLPVQYVIQAPNFEKLKEIIPVFMEKAHKSGVFQTVDLNLKFNKPELKITPDKDKARSLGVSVRDIAETLQLLYSGQRFGYFIRDGKQYQVIGEANRTQRDKPSDLQFIYIRNNSNELIQLDNLVTFENETTPPQLYRFNRYVSATVSASPAEGYTIGEGLDEMDKIAEEVLDDTFSTSLEGTSKEFKESSGSLIFAFILALVLIYLALSAQFESFADPLIIMFTVPLALAGAVLTLWLFNQTINIFSQIGIIVLIGIVTKNGILIVEFANQRKLNGLSIKDAVLDASAQRLRPILMTSLATILGAVPVAVALGGASTSRIPMGLAIIGGLIFSLVLSLYIIPALYTYISRQNKS